MKFVLLMLLFILGFAGSAAAQDNRNYKEFEKLPVLDGGRVKPLDSYARSFLLAASGRTAVKDMPASAWLAEAVFDPARAVERPIFRVFRPAVLDLPPRDRNLYTYLELRPALQARQDLLQAVLRREEADRSDDQRELLALWEITGRYTNLLRTMSFALPVDLEPPKLLNWPEGKPVTLAGLDYGRRAQLRRHAEMILRNKGDDESRYDAEEKRIVDFAAGLASMEVSDAASSSFSVIHGATGWQSPWQSFKIAQDGEPDPSLNAWIGLLFAYQGIVDGWEEAARDISKSVDRPLAIKLGLEVFYNKAGLLPLASLCYFAALFALAMAAIKVSPRFRILALLLLCGGGLANFAAIVLRVVILSRPPVGTLYESIIFVAFICVLAGLLVERARKDFSGLTIGGLGGLLLLLSAQAFSGEDSMQVLVAVLNTNFWLGTHVLCITIGYCFCLAAAIFAHILLVRRARENPAVLDVKLLKILLIASLLFTAVGTALGGIWADQSWGRFWGWDPKENGALLIVLWLVWLLHGAIGGQLNQLWLAAGTAFLSVIVAIAWFGVNLLSVGLHSYGFISGVAAALGSFCAAETLVIGMLVWRGSRRVPA